MKRDMCLVGVLLVLASVLGYYGGAWIEHKVFQWTMEKARREVNAETR